jgi:DNA modification methylase
MTLENTPSEHGTEASIALQQLLPDKRNARKRTDRSAKLIAESLQRYGAARSVVIDENNMLIAGHGTVEGAKAAGIKRVRVIETDGTELIAVKRTNWTEEEKVGANIADNRTSDLSDWDAEMLQQLSEEHDIAPWFEQEDLDALLQEAEQLEPVEGNTDPDEVPEAPEDPITKPGDLWILGNHRLLCGDSTNIQHVERLMDGQKADMVFTDPPYNIGYQDMGAKFEKIANDKMSDAEFLQFLKDTIQISEVMYVCCSWQYSHLFKQALNELGVPPKAMIVWDKVNPAQNLDLYFKQHEIIFYVGPFGGQSTVRGDVWQLKRQRNTLHPTMKPVELIEMALEDHSKRKYVFDGFGGSGSTLIACERLHRHARLIELSAAYCDVIVKRWEDFTGNKAILEESPEAF